MVALILFILFTAAVNSSLFMQFHGGAARHGGDVQPDPVYISN